MIYSILKKSSRLASLNNILNKVLGPVPPIVLLTFGQRISSDKAIYLNETFVLFCWYKDLRHKIKANSTNIYTHCSKYLKEHCVFAIDHNTNALIV